MAVSLIIALRLSSLLTLALLLGAFFYALAFWWQATLYRRLEPFFPWLFYPLQFTNGLIYLLRVAFSSFLRHGRRPGHPLFGVYQLGQLYNWKHQVYDEDETPHDWMRYYYNTWVSAANSVLFDSWMGEQNMTLFFRWGSFARYLFLLAYYGLGSLMVSTLGQRIFRSEILLLCLSTFWRCWPIFWRIIYKPFWWFSQALYRFALALAGEFHISVAMVYFKLEPFIGFQWYQEDNVDEYDSPVAIHRRPLPLPFYRYFWFSEQRQRRNRWYSFPWVSIFQLLGNLGAIFFLSLLLLPFASLSALLLGSYWLFYRCSLYHYFFFSSSLERAAGTFMDWGRDAGLWSLSWLFFALASLLLHCWATLLDRLAALGRFITRGVAFLGLALAVGYLAPFEFQPFLAFGFGSMLVEFVHQMVHLLSPITFDTEHLKTLSYGTNLLPSNFYELKTDWQEEVYYIMGAAFHGYHIGGFQTTVVGYANPPWLPPVRKPSIWVNWWHRKENHWWWDRPIFDAVPAQRRFSSEFLYSFQQSLYSNATVAYAAFNQDREDALDWYSLLMDSEGAREMVWRIPFEGIYAAANYVYYFLAYRFFYSRDGFYWVRLAWWYPFYTFCFSFSLVLDWAVQWPLYRLRLIIRSWAFFSPTFSAIFSAISRGLYDSVQGCLSLAENTFAWAIWSAEAVSGVSRLQLPAFNPLPNIFLPAIVAQRWSVALAFLWNLTGGWWLWFGSITFDELLRWPILCDLYTQFKSPSSSLLIFFRLTFLAPLDLWSACKALSLEGRRTSIWTMALSVYLWLQLFWDRLYLPVQVPRFLADFTLSYTDRFPKRAWLFENLYTPTHKGAMMANRRWQLPPVFLYRQSSQFHEQIHEYRTGFGWWTKEPVAFAWLNPKFAAGFQTELQPYLPVQHIWILDLSYLPYFLDDGVTVLLALLPFIYGVALLLFLGLFPGSTSLLFDRAAAGEPSPTTAIFNRQWAWDGCRYDQPFEDFETLFYRQNSLVLHDAKVATEYPWKPRSRYFFNKLYRRYLKIQGWPSLVEAFHQKRSLGGGKGYLLDLFGTDRRVLLLFANYLFKAKYKSLRGNLLNHGIDFLRFISINFRRNPWVPLCFNQYDQYDYHTWLEDASLDIAERCVQASAVTRRHLEKTDRFLFRKQLSHWVWYKDIGNQEFERTSDVRGWAELAYEVDDKDGEAYFPWGPLGWFLIIPFFLFAQAYLDLEMAWNSDALYPAAGSLELRRYLLLLHNIFGHISMFYEQMEWRGWWTLPDYQRTDNETTDEEELPMSGYFNRWDKSEGSCFYPVPMRSEQPASSWLPWGTSQPIGLLEEYAWAHHCVGLLLIILLPFAFSGTRPSKAAAGVFAYHARWPSLSRQIDSYRHIFVWFWK